MDDHPRIWALYPQVLTMTHVIRFRVPSVGSAAPENGSTPFTSVVCETACSFQEVRDLLWCWMSNQLFCSVDFYIFRTNETPWTTREHTSCLSVRATRTRKVTTPTTQQSLQDQHQDCLELNSCNNQRSWRTFGPATEWRLRSAQLSEGRSRSSVPGWKNTSDHLPVQAPFFATKCGWWQMLIHA